MKRDRRFKRTCYLAADTSICFVLVDRGRFMKTHVSVALVPCAECKAAVGSPCRGVDGPRSDVHYMRRRALRALSKR